jgi:hypothetical protein
MGGEVVPERTVQKFVDPGLNGCSHIRNSICSYAGLWGSPATHEKEREQPCETSSGAKSTLEYLIIHHLSGIFLVKHIAKIDNVGVLIPVRTSLKRKTTWQHTSAEN